MAKQLKRYISVLLAIVMLVSAVPVFATAANGKMIIKAESASAASGSTAKMKISIADNPGVSSIKLKVTYDSALTLTNVEYNEDMGGQTMNPGSMNSPVTLIWLSPFSNYSGDGTFATLTFSTPAGLRENFFANVSISYNEDDIYDLSEHNISCEVIDGMVSVFAGVPGDINGDGSLNTKDLTRLFQYFASWDVEVNEPALDVNGDGKVNNKDLTRLFQYLANWDVELFYGSGPAHTHSLAAHSASAATCTKEGNKAYWYCSGCGKYYSDSTATTEITQQQTVIPAKGHTVVIDPAVAPTETEGGFTEGSHCSVCKEVLVARTPIPALGADRHSITYNIANGDPYLAQQTIKNPNEDYYSESSGLTLKNISVPGYNFLGWYDLPSGSNAEIVKKIPAGETSDFELYAHWEKVSYTVTFDSPLVAVTDKTFTVDKGATLSEPSLAGYNFIGWSTDDNELVTRIPAGTTGNVTLHANWTSKRNQTRPVSKLGDPIVLEDTDNGTILFAYEIGTIENIPLKQISNVYQNTNGMKQTFTTEEEASVSESSAISIADSISDSTVNSSSWSLSEDWNDVVTVDESYAAEQGWTDETIDSHVKTSTGTYSLNSTSGGSNTSVTNTGISGTVYSDSTLSASSSTTKEKETGSEFNVNGKYSREGSAGVNLGILSVGTKGSIEIGASYGNYDKNKKTSTLSVSTTGTAGHSNTFDSSSSDSNTSTWNTSEGYSSSNSVSNTESVRNVLSAAVKETKDYGTSHAFGGSNTSNCGLQNSKTESKEYSSTISYDTTSKKTNAKTIELGGTNEGYYRFVLAGTAHVFAVVGYDVSTRAYFVNTYSVMDDSTYTFIDYSKNTPNFNDYENGVLPFEVPFYVKQYVDYRVGQTDGLRINTSTGMIDAYTGTAKTVFVPSYMSVDNIDGNGKPGFVKVTGISANAFIGNTSVEAISLGSFITSIPSNAFSGCTSLKEVIAPGVTSIGASAFSGCTSLTDFTVPAEITSLGTGAFSNVNKVTVTASSAAVAKNAVACGAKNIVLNISALQNELKGTTLTVSSTATYFELQGGNKAFSNLKLESNAKTTYLNGITFNNTTGTPLKLSSANVTMNGVTVTSNGLGMILTAYTTLSLRQNNTITSSSGKAILCKGMTLKAADSGVTGKLNASGNIYTTGTVSSNALLSQTNGSIITVSSDEYDRLLKGSFVITLDANGGTVSSTSLSVDYGTNVTLPTPTRSNYVFNGWYTAKSGGTKVTATSGLSGDTTLYAQWSVKSFTASWNTVSNCTITVKRTSSPVAGKATGTLTSGAAIYYGDVLSVTYAPASGFDIAASGSTSITVTQNVTSSNIYATVKPKQYTVSWTNTTGCVISVMRTSSPYGGGATGAISNNGKVYYGDKLTISYSANAGYTISTQGITSATVSGNITSSSIYATATANSYTYKIVYVSKNGTALGTSTVTDTFGASQTVTPPAKNGYNTPSAQNVVWDTAGEKTITFTYTPNSVTTSTLVYNGNWMTYMTSNAWIEVGERTSTTVKVRMKMTNKINAGKYYGYYQWCNIGTSSGKYTATKGEIANTAFYTDSNTSIERSATTYTSWIDVPASATTTSVTIYYKLWSRTSSSDDGYFNKTDSKTITIPTY